MGATPPLTDPSLNPLLSTELVPARGATESRQSSWLENPTWSGLDLLVVAFTLLLATVIFSGLAVGVLMTTPQFRGKNIGAVMEHPSMYIVVPAMGAAYAVMLAVLYLLAVVRGQRFWKSLSWNWPRDWWWVFLGAGLVLSLVAGLLQKILPTPKTLPIEEMFREPGAAWFLAVLGTAIAPFVEEVMFRGLLYPVASRWLYDVLNSQQRLRRGRLIFLSLVPWGFLVHGVSGKSRVLLALAVFVVAAAAFLVRSLNGDAARAARVILPGLAFLLWAQLAPHLGQRWLAIASLGLLLAVLAITWLGLKAQPGPAATHLAVGLGIILTAAAFAMVHGEQLAQSWSPLLVLFIVGLVLTITRAATKSLASSFLIHLGYNGTLFTALYLTTDHFRHMERMVR